MNFRQYITRNAGICGGQAVMAGTRVLLKTVLESLAEGATLQEILEDFPSLREEHVKAAIAFAAVAAAEDLPVPDLPKVS